jgi:hypothetical protein
MDRIDFTDDCMPVVADQLAKSGMIALDGLYASIQEMISSCNKAPDEKPRWAQHGSIFVNDTNHLAVGLPRMFVQRPGEQHGELIPYIRCIQEAGRMVSVVTPDQMLMLVYEKNELNVPATLPSDHAKWEVIDRLISLPGARHIGSSSVDPNRVSYVKRADETIAEGPRIRLWGGNEYVEVPGNDVYSVRSDPGEIDKLMAAYPVSYSYFTATQLRDIRQARGVPFGFHAVPIIADFLLGLG